MRLQELPYPERLAMAKKYPTEGPFEIQMDTLIRIFNVTASDAERIIAGKNMGDIPKYI